MPSLGLGLYLGASNLNTGVLVPPAGFAFRKNAEGKYLTDAQGRYLLRAI